MGRPTKKNPEKMAEIIRHVRDGIPIEHVAALCNIGEQTIRDWRRDDEDFRARIDCAKSRSIADLMKRVRNESGGAWKLLKNLDKKNFRENVELDHTSSDRSMSPNISEEQIKKAALSVLEVLEKESSIQPMDE